MSDVDPGRRTGSRRSGQHPNVYGVFPNLRPGAVDVGIREDVVVAATAEKAGAVGRESDALVDVAALDELTPDRSVSGDVAVADMFAGYGGGEQAVADVDAV